MNREAEMAALELTQLYVKYQLPWNKHNIIVVELYTELVAKPDNHLNWLVYTTELDARQSIQDQVAIHVRGFKSTWLGKIVSPPLKQYGIAACHRG